MKNIKHDSGSAALWVVIVAVMVLAGVGYFYYANNQSSRTSSLEAVQPQAQSQTQPQAAGGGLATSAPDTTVSSSLACDDVFPVSLIQAEFPGKTVTAGVSKPATGASVLACSHSVKNGSLGTSNISLKVFDASQESSYSTTIKQFVAEGYTCSSIDAIAKFPASNCVSGTIDIIAFTSTNNKYAVLVTDATIFGQVLPAQSLNDLAVAANSNLSSR